MATFTSLPQELRDLIYEHAGYEQSFYMISGSSAPKLVTDRNSTSLLLACKQVRAEYKEVLVQNAAVVLCFNKGSLEARPMAVPMSLTKRVKQLTVIVDLDGLKDPEWQRKDAFTTVSPTLFNVIAQMERCLLAFPGLQRVEVQWWNDLSETRDREGISEWTNALLGIGLVKSQELWFGYLGGKLHNPMQLRDHLLSQHNRRKQTSWRPVSKDGLNLLPEDDALFNGAKMTSITPLSFF
jgi:hypothetical protein